MSDNSDMLEVLQADVTALLQNVPALADAVVMADNEGDIETKVLRSLAPLRGAKRGLAVVVLLPEVTDSEENLPGPPVNVEIEIQTIEAVTINRQAGSGTNMRSSQAALITLNALHHQSFGSTALYAGKDPITPVKVKAGHVSHAVKLMVRANGLQGPGKVAGISADLGEGGDTAALTITGVTNPAGMNGEIPEVAAESGRRKWLRISAGFATAIFWDGATWRIEHGDGEDEFAFLGSDEDVATPDLVEDWVISSTETGYPVLAIGATGDTIILACETAGAAIYYTTDGTYPTPTNGTLYSDPFAAPAVGTTIRAAGYKTGLNPGDCLEFTLIDRTPDGTVMDGDLALADAGGVILTDL
jgi:hypothetical protein